MLQYRGTNLIVFDKVIGYNCVLLGTVLGLIMIRNADLSSTELFGSTWRPIDFIIPITLAIYHTYSYSNKLLYGIPTTYILLLISCTVQYTCKQFNWCHGLHLSIHSSAVIYSFCMMLVMFLLYIIVSIDDYMNKSTH